MNLDKKYLIRSESELREHYDLPAGRALAKQLSRLEEHSIRFIENSPFLCIATSSPEGWADCSPKGDAPGFVRVLDDQTIAMPDRRGNNRLDSIANLLVNPQTGLIFFIPGVNETLRINGWADISVDPELLKSFEFRGRLPTSVIVVHIEEVYLHCPKALIRSDLWARGGSFDGSFPTLTKMLSDQLGEGLEGEDLKNAEEAYEIKIKETLY